MMYCCGIVEDEPLAERMLRRYLKRFPFIEIAWECSYAEEAIDLIEKKNVDLLILDLQNVPILPDSAFFSLIAHQKCIIVTSVYPIQMLGISLNTIAFLDKPFTIESFTNAIEKFVAIVDD